MLGIPELDDDHWYLISLMEKLNKPDIDQNKLAAEFRAAFIQHCDREEKIMLAIGYPYIEYHRAEHKKLAHQIDLCIKRIAAGFGDEFIGNRLIRELYEHIDHHDLNIASFMRSKEN